MQCTCSLFRKLLHFVFLVYETALTADSEDDDDLGLGKNDTATEQAKLDNKTSGKPSTEPKFDTASKTPSFGFGKVPSSIALSDLGKEGSI